MIMTTTKKGINTYLIKYYRVQIFCKSFNLSLFLSIFVESTYFVETPRSTILPACLLRPEQVLLKNTGGERDGDRQPDRYTTAYVHTS